MSKVSTLKGKGPSSCAGVSGRPVGQIAKGFDPTGTVVHPFIETEKRDCHNVKRGYELARISRTAVNVRRAGKPGPRAVRDAELTERIADVRERSRSAHEAPRVHVVPQQEGERRGLRGVALLMRGAGPRGQHRG